ncbi:MAG: glutamate--cysteine ligase [Cyclobacteriaceae bacterium]
MMNKRLHLFEGYGVELEYMITDNQSLDVKPIAEVLLKDETGEILGEIEHGLTAWSNELISHVIEIKSNGPKSDLVALRDKFVADIREINLKLGTHGAMLMPGAAHPWMNPQKESKIWEHESQEIYQAYDRIFDCKGHGWSNLQSTHINLPFYDDEEFAALHTAIRFIMPMLPALTASSPILGEKFTGYLDKRLYYYEKNQSKIPVLTGRVIPEKLFSKHQYQKHIYDRIANAIKPLDAEGILKPVWLNSRGAMARFDRGAIEIRIIDIQECVSADLAIVGLVTTFVKLLVKEKLVSFKAQESFETEDLYQIFRACVKYGSQAVLPEAYASVYGFDKETRGSEFWRHIIQKCHDIDPDAMAPWLETLHLITEKGTLAERIMLSVDNDYTRANLKNVYGQLSQCLQSDTPFMP